MSQRKEYVILGVDDETDVLEILADMLSSIEGVRFLEVSNGFSAGAKLVEERPDLILLDFLMPELDGFEFCRFVRQDPRFKDVPVIAVSGLKGDAEFAKMREAGANDILTKPFSMDQLVKKIESFRSAKHQQKAA